MSFSLPENLYLLRYHVIGIGKTSALEHGPPKLIVAGKEFPFIVVSPQCPTASRGWQPHELSALLDEIVEKYKVDKERIYVTGLSMGGFGTWVFHEAKDPAVPLQRSEEMVDALKKAGGNVKLTVYPEAGHDSWTEAYNDPELYQWLLQPKRTPRKMEGKKR